MLVKVIIAVTRGNGEHVLTDLGYTGIQSFVEFSPELANVEDAFFFIEIADSFYHSDKDNLGWKPTNGSRFLLEQIKSFASNDHVNLSYHPRSDFPNCPNSFFIKVVNVINQVFV